MKQNHFVLKTVADFAPGAFENTAVEDGSIQLGRSGISFILSGCYTSPVLHVGSFLSMLPSWNASTPKGTAVEVQGRIGAGFKWSRWFSFGKWSPFIDRASTEFDEDEIGEIETEYLKTAKGHSPAENAQIRIFLYTEDEKISPKVHLLAANFRCVRKEKEEEVTGERLLEIPAYSSLVRDPSLGSRIMSVTSLCMLMNRWGEDVLPEEVARAMYDSQSGRYGNLAFLTAIAGSYGFECYTKEMTLNALRKEIRIGNAVGVVVQYRAPSISEDAEAEILPEDKALPELEGAVADSHGHVAVLRGFIREKGEDFVVLNDPLTSQNSDVVRKIPLEKFENLYKGTALILHRGTTGAGEDRPVRRIADVMISENKQELFLTKKGSILLEGYNDPVFSTSCYTIADGVAYASAAQKRFYYSTIDESGFLKFDNKAAAGKRITVYLIGSRGLTWIGEKRIEKIIPEQEQEE